MQGASPPAFLTAFVILLGLGFAPGSLVCQQPVGQQPFGRQPAAQQPSGAGEEPGSEPPASRPSKQEPGQPATRPQQTAKPVVVTATRAEQDPFDSPYATSWLDAKDVRTRLQARTTPEGLRDLPGVSVQKTAHGQGSPKIRGLTGYYTLLLVDGIRINDSTWRSGNNEYWNHVDPHSFERFEVVRGPGSVLWGSDAVAGVGQALQKGRRSFEPGMHAQGLVLSRYSSAESSWTTRAETQGNAASVGWHLGATYKDFDDLQAGRDVGLLPYTAYTEADGDLKLSWQIAPDQVVSFGVQLASLPDVPRTHSTTRNKTWRGITAGSDLVREHDHRRQLYWLQYEVEGEGAWFDRCVATVTWKDRYEREDRIASNGRESWNVTHVGTAGGYLQFEKGLGEGKVVYGVDWYHDFVESDSREYNADGSLRGVSSRGVVAGDANYDLAGAYAQLEAPLGGDLRLVAGLRGSYAQLDAEQVDVPGDAIVYPDIDEDWKSLTGSVRLVWDVSEEWRVFGGASQAFRAPNLSDTTRFDIARTGELEVPATDLDEEHYTTLELGCRLDDGRFAVGLTGWLTFVRDQIARQPTGNVVNGLREVTKANAGDGWLAGLEAEGVWRLDELELRQWRVFGNFDYVAGVADQFDNAGVEVEDRVPALPPATGLLGLGWENEERTRGAEAYVRMAYHVDETRYTDSDRANTSRIPPDGLPGYAVFGLRGWTEVGKHLIASLAVENLTDVDYRIMDSGLQEPGANVIVTLQARF
jgi:hemoglobin/transferrin/lactoferrin receptor protein